MKKVLLVSSSGFSKKEGISTFLLDEIQNISKESNFKFHLIVSGKYNKQLISQFTDLGVKIYLLPSRKRKIISYIRCLLQIMRNNRFDIIHVNGSSTMLGVELLIAKLTGVRLRIAHSHNSKTEHPIINIVCKPIFNYSYNKAISCGDSAGNWLFNGGNYEIVKNGREIDKYKYSPKARFTIRNHYGVKDDEILIGHVGAFNDQKNQQFLINVLEKVRMVKPAKLILVGDGPKLEFVKNKVRENSLQDYVIFTGEISNVEELIQAVDIMALPSLFEGLPLVVVEWQIAGIPCVVSENVDHECKFTDLVSFASLSSNIEVWSSLILQKYKTFCLRDRINYPKIAQENGYDIVQSAKKIASIYNEKI